MLCSVPGCSKPATRSDDGSACQWHKAAMHRKNPNADGQGPCLAAITGEPCKCGWRPDWHQQPVVSGEVDE